MTGGEAVGRARLLQIARTGKHRLMLARKRIIPVIAPIRDVAYRSTDRLRPWTYEPGSLPQSFVSARPKMGIDSLPSAPSRIYVLWTGENAMSSNRAAALADVRSKFDVTLVTPTNLSAWVLDDAPLHPAYEALSLVHRADYLRAYLMRHHGGTYLDIKHGYGDVCLAVDRLNSSPDLWMAGCREPGADTVAADDDATLRVLRRRHGSVLGMCAFASRPGSPLTVEWLDEVHHRLDLYLSELEQHPGDALGQNPGYPIPWTGILGAVLHPLCLKYADRLLMDQSFMPGRTDYR